MKRGRKPKLSMEDIREIKRMYAVVHPRWSVPQIARSFSVSVATIHKALNGKLPPITR